MDLTSWQPGILLGFHYINAKRRSLFFSFLFYRTDLLSAFTAAMNMAQAKLLECKHLHSMAMLATPLAALLIYIMYCPPTVRN